MGKATAAARTSTAAQEITEKTARKKEPQKGLLSFWAGSGVVDLLLQHLGEEGVGPGFIRKYVIITQAG